MKECELLIVGGGPAGLCAAINAARAGASVTLLERSPRLGGQLVKQTHMFFGAKEQYASTRGVDIAPILVDALNAYKDRVEVLTDTVCTGIYEDGVVTALYKEERYIKLKPKAVIIAAGASEKNLAFINNDLPGIYGAGAVQTLMNVYGVVPGKSVVMLGAGNIGLIVSYQLMQAGIEVKCILDAAQKIGGYLVHASKVARMGVPILIGHTVKRAIGNDCLEAVEVVKLDERFNEIPGSEFVINADTLCVSIGLTPLCELISMAGAKMRYVPTLGGLVPLRNAEYETTVENLFVAGDSSGVEEASATMVEGYIAGLCAASKLGYRISGHDEAIDEYRRQLDSLRSGPAGEHIKRGIEQAAL